MIVFNQTMQDQAPRSQVSAQLNGTAVQLDPNTFGLLLAMLGQSDSAPSGRESSVLAFGGNGDSSGESIADESDQLAVAAKIADWFAANPASMAALNAFVGSLGIKLPSNQTDPAAISNALAESGGELAHALIGSGLTPAIGQGERDVSPSGNVNSQMLDALTRALGQASGISGSTDAAVKGNEFLSSIQSAADGQSLAAALMVAIASHERDASVLSKQPSNQVLATSVPDGLSLADALAQAIPSETPVNRQGDSDSSKAAALMVAIGSHERNASVSSKQSSNQLLANSVLGGLSLVDALAQVLPSEAPTKGLNGAVPNSLLPGGESEGMEARLLRLMGQAKGVGEDGSGALRGDVVSNVPADLASGVSAYAAEEQRTRNLLAGDALIATGSGVGAELVSMQQAMTSQSFGRWELANARAVEGTVSWLASQQGGSATIDLTPPELGSIRLELKINAAGESASLVVHAASDAARAAIEQSLDRLYESFQSSGLELQVSVGSGSSGFAQNFSNGLNSGLTQLHAEVRAKESRAERASTPNGNSVKASDTLSLYA